MMSSPADLERRFRSAVPDPDTDRALADVLSRIGRRRRRVVAAMAVVVAGVVSASAIAFVQLRDDEDAPVFVGEPDDGGAAMRLRWSAHDVGTLGNYVLSDGLVVLAWSGTVFAATGSERSEITALERSTGDVQWTAQLAETAFLQGVAEDVLIVSTQSQIIGLDVVDGHRRWTITLADIGLESYRAVRSAMNEPISAVGLSTPTEGDGRAPHLIGVDVSSGDVVWDNSLGAASEDQLASGVQIDDLVFGAPPVEDDDTVFFTQSRAYLIELSTGSLRWSVTVGDGQGFGSDPAVFDGDAVHVPSYPDVRTVARADGSTRWERAGHGAALVGRELWSLTADGSVQQLDRDTGEVLASFDPPGQPPSRIVGVRGLVGLVGTNGLTVFDRDGAVRLRGTWPGAVVDLAVERGEVLVATDDGAVHVFEIDLDDEAQCDAPTSEAPVVESYLVTVLPAGFTPAGRVERTSTGNADEGGETRSVQRFVDDGGRVIEVVDLSGYDPAAMVTAAHDGAPSEPVTIRRCTETVDGLVVAEYDAELSTSQDRIVVGAMEWEYGGFAVIGGPEVTVGEVLAVAAGLRHR